MRYAVLFEDHADKAEARTNHMAAHLAFLEANAEAIVAAGPLFSADTPAGAGGLWIVEAESAEAVMELVEADPFWPTGLRKSTRILAWRRVFADGARLI